MKNWFFWIWALLIILMSGCGHNRVNTYDTFGAAVALPVGDLGSISICLGSSKTTTALVRGGSTFTTETAEGAGLFSGAGGTARVHTFKANEQLNEGNLVKILTDPAVPDQAKVVLASQLASGVKAPPVDPSAMVVREASVYSNGFSNQINDVFSPTGIDKISGDVEKIVNNVVDTVEDTTGHVVDTVHGTATSTADMIVDATENLSRKQFWAAIAGLIGLLSALIWYFSKKEENKKKPTTSTDLPEPPTLTKDKNNDGIPDDEQPELHTQTESPTEEESTPAPSSEPAPEEATPQETNDEHVSKLRKLVIRITAWFSAIKAVWASIPDSFKIALAKILKDRKKKKK